MSPNDMPHRPFALPRGIPMWWHGPAYLVAALTAACATPDASDRADIATHDSAGVTIVEIPRAVIEQTPSWTLGDRLATVGGETADANHDMTHVEVGLLDSAGFVVGDRAAMQLRRFSLTGTLEATGAGKGDGPGELLYLGSVFRTPGGVAVVDPFRGSLLTFDHELSFQQQVMYHQWPGGQRAEVLSQEPDGALVAVSGPPFPGPPAPEGEIVRSPLVVARVASANGPVDTLFTIRGNEYYFIGGGTQLRRFGVRSILHRVGSDFLSGDGGRWQFQLYDAGGNPRRIIRLAWARRAVTEPMRAEKLRIDRKEIDDLPPGGFTGVRRMAALDFANPRFPDSLPAFDDSHLGRDGTLWLREGTAPSDSLQRWFVFRGDSLLGRLTLPAELTMLDARQDRVLVRRSDALDLGYVELWSLDAARAP